MMPTSHIFKYLHRFETHCKKSQSSRSMKSKNRSMMEKYMEARERNKAKKKREK